MSLYQLTLLLLLTKAVKAMLRKQNASEHDELRSEIDEMEQAVRHEAHLSTRADEQ